MGGGRDGNESEFLSSAFMQMYNLYLYAGILFSKLLSLESYQCIVTELPHIKAAAEILKGHSLLLCNRFVFLILCLQQPCRGRWGRGFYLCFTDEKTSEKLGGLSKIL